MAEDAALPAWVSLLVCQAFEVREERGGRASEKCGKGHGFKRAWRVELESPLPLYVISLEKTEMKHSTCLLCMDLSLALWVLGNLVGKLQEGYECGQLR